MGETILKHNFPSKRVRLSREELLAGKCFPDENEFSLDPRLRSPDDLLSQRMHRNAPPSEAPALESIAETLISTPAPDPGFAALQQRYEREMAAWNHYEKKVQEWKQEVTAILEQYKAAALEKDDLARQLQEAQAKMKAQADELKWFREQLNPSSPTF
jgi:hypothetical protein